MIIRFSTTFLIALLLIHASCLQLKEDELSSSASPLLASSPTEFTVDWMQVRQTIDGFGCQAARLPYMYTSKNRKNILDMLFGANGLNLNIVRGKVFPDMEFGNMSNIVETPEQESQQMLLKDIRTNYNVSTVILSPWSPPYKWKTYPSGKGFVNLRINRLKSEHFTDYAQYLANYLEYYHNIGIPIYAVSTQNEPEFPTPSWDGCVWLPIDNGKFITAHLKPELQKRNIATKLIVSENGNYNVANVYLLRVRSQIGANFSNSVDILATHGYTVPLPAIPVTFEAPSNTFAPFAVNQRKWVTEASCTQKYDDTMTTGIKLAKSLHSFFTNAGVNAYIFWLGMSQEYHNEALIIEDPTSQQLIIPKVYYVLGHYSKFIGPNWSLVDTVKPFSFIPSSLHVSTYINGKGGFVIVAINSGSTEKEVVINLGTVNVNHFEAIETNNDVNWQKMDSRRLKMAIYYPSANILESHIQLSMSPLSVVTVFGKCI